MLSLQCSEQHAVCTHSRSQFTVCDHWMDCLPSVNDAISKLLPFRWAFIKMSDQLQLLLRALLLASYYQRLGSPASAQGCMIGFTVPPGDGVLLGCSGEEGGGC